MQVPHVLGRMGDGLRWLEQIKPLLHFPQSPSAVIPQGLPSCFNVSERLME